MFSTATLKPERVLILILEELQEPLTDPVSSLLIETNFIDLVDLKFTSTSYIIIYKQKHPV